MKKENLISAVVGGVIVLAAFGLGTFTRDVPQSPSRSTPSESRQGGIFNASTQQFEEGIQFSQTLTDWEYVTLRNGTNQASVQNKSGRDRFVDYARFSEIADAAGTRSASSTFIGFVATSSSATFSSDFARPSVSFALIDAGVFATSSSLITVTSTSTDAGQGTLLWRSSEFIVFQLQSQEGCIANAACETATSSSRGIDWEGAFHWTRKGDL